MIYEIANTGKASALFGGWQETLIWSWLQGVMGKIYGNDPDHPTAALALLGDFAFFAGESNTELAAYRPDQSTQDFIIMVPQNESWQHTITEFYGNRANIVSRYAIKKEPDIFDKQKLDAIVSALPAEYELRMIDESLYHMCRSESWSADLVSQYPAYEDYRRLGLGAVILKNNKSA